MRMFGGFGREGEGVGMGYWMMGFGEGRVDLSRSYEPLDER